MYRLQFFTSPKAPSNGKRRKITGFQSQGPPAKLSQISTVQQTADCAYSLLRPWTSKNIPDPQNGSCSLFESILNLNGEELDIPWPWTGALIWPDLLRTSKILEKGYVICELHILETNSLSFLSSTMSRDIVERGTIYRGQLLKEFVEESWVMTIPISKMTIKNWIFFIWMWKI